MATSENVKVLLLIACYLITCYSTCYSTIEEEEDLLLIANINQGEGRKVNLNMPYWNYEPFNLHNWTNDECWVEFRFQKDDFVNLIRTFELLPHIITYNRLKVDTTEATYLLFRRFAYTCRYTDLVFVCIKDCNFVL